MRTILRTAMTFFAVISFLSLSGCSKLAGLRPAELTPESLTSSGLVLASVSRVYGLANHPSYYFDLRSANGSEYNLRVLADSLSSVGPDLEENGVVRYITALYVPPGRYELVRFRAVSASGFARSVSFSFSEPPMFHVEAGKTYYLGSAVVISKIETDWLGIPNIPDVRFTMASNAEQDVALAHAVYPNLPEVEIVQPASKVILSADDILRWAKRVNPDESLWLWDSWERVKNMD